MSVCKSIPSLLSGWAPRPHTEAEGVSCTAAVPSISLLLFKSGDRMTEFHNAKKTGSYY